MTRLDTIPAYLREHGLFCLWKYEERDGRRTKMPYNPNNQQERARSNDRRTFAPLMTAAAAATGFDGLGIGIFDSVAAIDIDHCIKDGELSEMAADIVQTMDAYTEISPSGEGLRLLFLAPEFSYDSQKYYINNSSNGLEIYLPGMTKKYVTVTGNALPGRAVDMMNRADRLQSILDKYMKHPQQNTQGAGTIPGTPANLSDAELIQKAMKAGNGGLFSALWKGNWEGFYSSQSEADISLCNLLAFWTGKDAARMDSLFRQSGLFRGKWDRKQSGTTYGAITIEKAIASCREVYTPPQERPQATQTGAQPAPDNVPQEPQNAPQERPKSPVQLFNDFLDNVQTEAFRPIKTGMPAFDNLLGGGIRPQSLVILSAAPGTGKTTLAQQIFETAAEAGTDVIFLNLEMSREQLLARSLSRIAHKQGQQISAADILQGYAWTDIQKEIVFDAAKEYRENIAPRMYYNPTGCRNDLESIMDCLNEFGEAAKAAGKRAPVCVLDYLHLVSAAGKDDPGEVIKKAVSSLKGYAEKYNSYVLAISANNRTSNSSGVISQSSGRDTSAIEYSADYQLSLNYWAFYTKEKIKVETITEDGKRIVKEEKADASNPDHLEALMKQKPRQMYVQVLKSRMTEPGGKLRLAFDAAHSTFTPIEKNRTAPAYMEPDADAPW